MAIAAILTMYAAFLVVGWLAARKVKGGTAADLIVAGRSMPLLLATLTMTATWVDGGYLLGTTEGTFKTSIASGLQGGVCFGFSLILGGLFFARRMRELEFTTLADPFEARFGRHWAAVLFLPAIAGEIFWSAELLVAIGSTFSVMLRMQLTTAILLSAIVVIAYTMVGGMWSVAYTDAFQLGLVVIGLLVALPYRARRCRWARSCVVGVCLDTTSLGWSEYARVVGCKRHAAARRHTVELLFSASAFVQNAKGRSVAFAACRRLHDSAHDSSIALWCGGGRVLVARRTPARADGSTCDHPSFVADGSHTSLRGAARAWGNSWSRHIELQLIDPLGCVTDQLEWSAPAARSGSLDAAIEGDHTRIDCSAWSVCSRHGAQGAKRSGALVLYKRSRIRAAFPSARLRALRFKGKQDRIDCSLLRVVNIEIWRR